MKELIYKKGNLLTDESIDVIGHCCNCQNKMGSGIAKSIKELYPEAYDADCEAKGYNLNKLGNVSKSYIKRNDRDFYVYNLYGQKFYGSDNDRYLDYEAIYTSLEKMKDWVDHLSDCGDDKYFATIGFPKNLGSQRAGGNWNIIEIMIKVVFNNYQGDVVIVEFNE